MQRTYVSRCKAAKWLNVAPKTVEKICSLNGITKHVIPGHNRIYFRADLIQNLVNLSGMQSDANGKAVSE
jgi:hypothetical protein